MPKVDKNAKIYDFSVFKTVCKPKNPYELKIQVKTMAFKAKIKQTNPFTSKPSTLLLYVALHALYQPNSTAKRFSSLELIVKDCSARPRFSCGVISNIKFQNKTKVWPTSTYCCYSDHQDVCMRAWLHCFEVGCV